MAEYNRMTESRRPAVRLLVTQARQIDLQAVLWGLEEEGIPVEIEEVASGRPITLAKEAAHMSPLNVGIGIDGREGTVVLHHRDLPEDRPLFVLKLREVGTPDLRRLGINAARLVKSEPLVLKDEPSSERAPKLASRVASDSTRKQPDGIANEPPADIVERIVERVLAEMVRA